jgi:two-component system, OmpR family, phosphate regulon sensor histidine kinase PhoR
LKIRHKLLLILLATAAITSAALGLGSARVLRDALRERFAERLRVESGLLSAWVAAGGTAKDDAESVAVAAAAELHVRVTLLAADGRVLGDSARHLEDLSAMENHLTRPEVAQAARDGVGEATRVSSSTGIGYFYTARRVEGAGPVRFVRVALPIAEIQKVESHYLLLSVSLTLAALLLLTGIAYAFVRRVSRPIERVSLAAERTTAGDLAAEVPYEGRDEVANLGASVHRMRNRLLEKIADLDAERALMASVLAGMREGVLLVGADLRIELANEAFRRIFDVSIDPAGRRLAEVIRNPSVRRDLDRALAEGREVHDLVLEAADSGRSFEVHVTPLPSMGADRPSRVLVLFFDVTRLMALESVRREFVADVSHELRTPLTSIAAFVETLLDGGLADTENAVGFLKIVRKHAERMGALIDDLTDLSLIETGAVDFRMEDVDASEVAREATSLLRQKHAARDVTITTEVPSPFLVNADRRRLEQVLLNLIDNGIKFNRPGGNVRVTGHVEGERPVLVVEDTGIGIPADSLEKVFNRFYRVDKARSRDMGGTGLGLAIVKHLMRLHGGSVRVESEPGRGSRFILEFPLRRNAGEGASSSPTD